MKKFIINFWLCPKGGEMQLRKSSIILLNVVLGLGAILLMTSLASVSNNLFSSLKNQEGVRKSIEEALELDTSTNNNISNLDYIIHPVYPIEIEIPIEKIGTVKRTQIEISRELANKFKKNGFILHNIDIVRNVDDGEGYVAWLIYKRQK